MDSNELKEMITSFIDAVKHNFDLYYDHVSNRSKYPPNEYKKNGDPNADQKFGYKVKRDMKIPASGYRNLKITTRITSSGNITSRPGINFLASGQKATEGIYPYFCYDPQNDILYLNYGTSDEKKPKTPWSYSPTISLNKVEKSPNSRIYEEWHKACSTYTVWNYDDILKKLDGMIDDLEITLGISRTKRTDGSVGSGTGNVVSPTIAPASATTISSSFTPSHPLNLILYGPPGTGKTYNTLFKSLEIIEGKTKEELEKKKKDQDEKWGKDTNKPKTEKKGYELLKGWYDKYVKTGQIIFTTFHQSMSYEDFIEGIKPNVEGNEMTYEVQDGIFKKLCKSASNEYYDVDFDKCYNDFVSKLGGRLKLKSSGGKEFYVDLNSKGNLNLYTTSKQNFNGVLTKEKIKQTLLGKEDYWKGYMMGVINHLKDKYGLKDPQKVDEQRNYVLIIDEINRGNVAQIFGELITLIEDNKRLGNSESMTATLPYSQDKFGVPNNLYIIGTMNTADRSVEALDTALRRRFSFKEMMPDYSLLENKTLCGVNLGALLKTINDRIKVLKDREHQIGHSYFMGHDDKNEDGSDKYPNKEEWLTNVFKDKIIPLLQEYFYGDYKKMYYVLGPGFVEKKNEKTIFAIENPDYDEFDIPEERYDIVSFDAKFNIKDAIDKLKVQKLDSGTGTMST